MSEIEKKEEWYLNIDYREAKEIIRNKLQGMTQNLSESDSISGRLKSRKASGKTDMKVSTNLPKTSTASRDLQQSAGCR